MGQGLLKDVDNFDLDPGSEWDRLSNELDDALPNLDRWDVEIRKLLADDSRSENAGSAADLLVASKPVKEEPKKLLSRSEKLPRRLYAGALSHRRSNFCSSYSNTKMPERSARKRGFR